MAGVSRSEVLAEGITSAVRSRQQRRLERSAKRTSQEAGAFEALRLTRGLSLPAPGSAEARRVSEARRASRGTARRRARFKTLPLMS